MKQQIIKLLDPREVQEEFNLRARKRKGIAKVLSNRFSNYINEKFDSDVKTLLNKHFKESHFKNVLEVGVGIGRIAPFFIERSETFYGVDFSEGMLNEASKNLSPHKNIELIYGDASELEFKKGFFDLGILSLILKHNNDKQTRKIIKNMKKWCKKILLIEHVIGGALGSKIAVIRTFDWYKREFLPKRITIHESFHRDKDCIVFCFFESSLQTFLLIRHGVVEVPHENFIYGQRHNPPLSMKGKREMRELARKKSLFFNSIDQVYSSALHRSLETAHLLFRNKPIIQDERLKEIDFGAYSGVDIRDHPKVFSSKYKSLLKHNQPFTDGESILSVKKRLNLFNKEILKSGKSSFCIVSHQWLLNCYMKLLLHTNEEFIFEQGKITQIILEDGEVISYKHNV
ncbi:MAG: histidine phosphatase family protein [Nanoarchaeota archaeon]